MVTRSCGGRIIRSPGSSAGDPNRGPFSDDMATRPDFTTSSRYVTHPDWVVLGDDLPSPNTPPRGMIPMTGRGPQGLRSTYYLTSDLSPVTVHINSRLPSPTTTQHHIATTRHLPRLGAARLMLVAGHSSVLCTKSGTRGISPLDQWHLQA
ncbi:hypothetical protein TIFTF001_031870 [Ficus carica]|uniref:Uncharacterized protein n=1 Tax=Ficus carica TaxID=3494 RepID=A0AA88DVP7_FICCA|nr:hypothetical protein TIFTF001_031870 [Ficus carica]